MIDANAFQQPFNFPTAGPSGFGGPLGGSFLGQNLLGQQQPGIGMGMGMGMAGQQQGSHHGFSPWMMLSPLLGAFMSGHPNLGLGMISPGLGIARALGAFK